MDSSHNTAPSPNEIHAHQVLEMMASSNAFFSTESLLISMAERFGAHARYYLCSGSGLTGEELIEVLWAKGKFAGRRESFWFEPAAMCSH